MTKDVGGSSFFFAHCTVCKTHSVNRFRAVFAPVCSHCGCKLKQKLIIGFATHLLSEIIIVFSVIAAFWQASALPLVIGFTFALASTGLGMFVPNPKDPETKIRIRVRELKEKNANENGAA